MRPQDAVTSVTDGCNTIEAEGYTAPQVSGLDAPLYSDRFKFYVTAKKTIDNEGFDRVVETYFVLDKSGERRCLPESSFLSELASDINSNTPIDDSSDLVGNKKHQRAPSGKQ